MTLYTSKNKVPQNAIEISEDEAYEYQMKIVSEWKPKSDVWPLLYSPGILGGLGATTGIYLNNYFRKKLFLGNYGKLSTYLPIVVLPTLGILFTHHFFITKPILLRNISCSTCIEIRSMMIQLGLGTLYPLFLAPLPCFTFATMYKTYNIPPLKEPTKLIAILKDFTKPLLPKLGYIAMAQIIIAVFMANLQFNTAKKLDKKNRLKNEELSN